MAIAEWPSTFTLPPIAIDWSPVTTAPSSGERPLPMATPCVTSAATREFDPITIVLQSVETLKHLIHHL